MFVEKLFSENDVTIILYLRICSQQCDSFDYSEYEPLCYSVILRIYWMKGETSKEACSIYSLSCQVQVEC